jgi:hypothetical protein
MSMVRPQAPPGQTTTKNKDVSHQKLTLAKSFEPKKFVVFAAARTLEGHGLKWRN